MSDLMIKGNEKEVAYLLPLLADWLSTAQEEDVSEETFLADLRNGAVLARVLSTMTEAQLDADGFHDPPENNQQINHNIQVVRSICQKRLKIPVDSVFRQEDLDIDVDYEDEESRAMLLYNEDFGRVVETLCYLAKVAEKHPHLRSQMPPQLVQYLRNNVSLPGTKPPSEPEKFDPTLDMAKRESSTSGFMDSFKPFKKLVKAVTPDPSAPFESNDNMDIFAKDVTIEHLASNKKDAKHHGSHPQHIARLDVLNEAISFLRRASSDAFGFKQVNLNRIQFDINSAILVAGGLIIGILIGIVSSSGGVPADMMQFEKFPCQKVNNYESGYEKEGAKYFYCMFDDVQPMSVGYEVTYNSSNFDKGLLKSNTKRFAQDRYDALHQKARPSGSNGGLVFFALAVLSLGALAVITAVVSPQR